jgi:molybdenum cofactor synthesis domain-containing protein
MEAQAKLLNAVRSKVLPTEIIALDLAVGRVLAKNVHSSVNIPGYDKTFVDGYAIRPQDTDKASTAKPIAFKIMGKLFPADYPTDARVSSGEAIYVACGAPIPKGAEATVKVEETRLNGNQIQIIRPIKPGEGIIPQGDDVKAGELILRKGQILRPQDVGLLAQVGLTEAEVATKPVIAILSGGDELIKQCRKGLKKISNNYALVVAQLAMELGAKAQLKGIMPDTLEEVQTRIGHAVSEADIVVTIGGSSVGMKDFVPDAINALGKPGVVVQGIALRPGAVSGFGIVKDKPVVMLPGHIGSCIAGFYVFVAPLIRLYNQMGDDGLPPCLMAELATGVDSGPQFRFQLLHLKSVEGKLLAEPVEGGSSALSTIVKSNGYTIIASHTSLLAGAIVDVHLFSKLEFAQIT